MKSSFRRRRKENGGEKRRKQTNRPEERVQNKMIALVGFIERNDVKQKKTRMEIEQVRRPFQKREFRRSSGSSAGPEAAHPLAPQRHFETGERITKWADRNAQRRMMGQSSRRRPGQTAGRPSR